jgi:chromatin remodeling complex protein RSC6
MANKKTQKTSKVQEPVEEVADEVVEEVVEEEQVKETKPKKIKKDTSVKKEKDTTKSETSSKKEDIKDSTQRAKVSKKETVIQEEVSDDISDEKSSDPKKRVLPTKESVLASFDEIIEMIDVEISSIRETQAKVKGVKFLRTLNKKLKTLKNQSSRIIKQRNVRKTSGVSNNNSGFLKPVKISTEMAKFTGWNANELKSRVDVTKYICDYIKTNNLQNPTDKRQIIADPKLSKLLNYDAKKASEPLTYYRIQSYIKPHFLKQETV